MVCLLPVCTAFMSVCISPLCTSLPANVFVCVWCHIWFLFASTQSVGRPPLSIPPPAIELFCKNMLHLKAVRTRSLEVVLAQPDVQSIAEALEEPYDDPAQVTGRGECVYIARVHSAFFLAVINTVTSPPPLRVAVCRLHCCFTCHFWPPTSSTPCTAGIPARPLPTPRTKEIW